MTLISVKSDLTQCISSISTEHRCDPCVLSVLACDGHACPSWVAVPPAARLCGWRHSTLLQDLNLNFKCGAEYWPGHSWKSTCGRATCGWGRWGSVPWGGPEQCGGAGAGVEEEGRAESQATERSGRGTGHLAQRVGEPRAGRQDTARMRICSTEELRDDGGAGVDQGLSLSEALPGSVLWVGAGGHP